MKKQRKLIFKADSSINFPCSSFFYFNFEQTKNNTMKKLFLSMAVIAAFGIASCGAEKTDAEKEGKEKEKKELSKTEKIAEELCACNDVEVAEIAKCMNDVQANNSEVSKEEIKEIMDISKECVEEMQAKMQEYQKEMLKEAAANDTLATDESVVEEIETVEETK